MGLGRGAQRQVDSRRKRGWLARFCALAVVWMAAPAAAVFTISSGPSGLSGETIVLAPPGGSVVIYQIELLGITNLTRLTQIDIRISPLAAPLSAGLAQADFDQLRLVESINGVFGDGDDTLLNTVAPGAIDVIGGVTSVTDGGNATPLLLATRFYFIVADVAAGATDGNTFRLGADADHVQSTLGSTLPPVGAVTAANADRVVVNQLNPEISLSPASLGFGNVAVSGSSILNLTVSNVGAATMNVTNVQSTNPVFSAAPTAFAVAPAGNQVVAVTFMPVATGLQGGNLAVTFNPTVNVAISGTGGFAGTMAGSSAAPTGRPIPVGLEWLAGLLFAAYGIYRLTRSPA